ncbi:MAG: hypothetical protein J2P17_00935 [Mycobacterium sp.]|nr:hypothetical protein [Mycobacterium sp.]
MTGTNTGPLDGEGAGSTTPWSAAYIYAAAMRELSISRLDPAATIPTEYFDVPTMLVTYALADYACREDLAVTGPADLGNLSGTQLWERLAPGRLMNSLSRVSPFNEAILPAEGEPLYQQFHRMMAYGDTPIDRARLRILGAAHDQPYEALHLAAAFAGALYQIPECVPDQRAEVRHLAEANLKLAQGDIAGFEAASRRAPASRTIPAPSASARQADARKKKARKASRKARKQRRR